MRAVYYTQFRQPPVVAALPDPTPAPGGVVIKVEATGLVPFRLSRLARP